MWETTQDTVVNQGQGRGAKYCYLPKAWKAKWQQQSPEPGE